MNTVQQTILCSVKNNSVLIFMYEKFKISGEKRGRGEISHIYCMI